MQFTLLAIFILTPRLFAAEIEEPPVEKIVFASCFKEGRGSQALQTIVNWDPDIFIWMGDNIYGDSQDMAVLREKYDRVRRNEYYVKTHWRQLSDNPLIIS